MGRAITIRGFQLIANLALFRQRQALFGDGRSGDVAAQPFQFVTLSGFGRHTGVQGESSHTSDRRGVIGIAFIRQRLQSGDVTALSGTHRDAVGNGMPSQLIHRVFIQTFQRQITVLGISLQ